MNLGYLCKRSCLLFLNISFIFLLTFFLAVHLNSSSPLKPLHLTTFQPLLRADTCKGLHLSDSHQSKCSYLHSHKNPCVPQGYIDYLQIFYCAFGGHPSLGYAALLLWLLVLFYLLANTASEYFCSSLGGLSRVLRLPPTIAGVTLLALGNGATDVFASLVSFSGGGGVPDVGLSSVVGGALFVSSVVVGIISIGLGPSAAAVIDRRSFVRDLCFLILVLSCLLVILATGRIGIWGSIAFMSLYVVYVILVWLDFCCKGEGLAKLKQPLIDIDVESREEEEEEEEEVEGEVEERGGGRDSKRKVLSLLELPFDLPRRLTIPDVSEKRWSKPYTVASSIMAPLLLATIWTTQRREYEEEEITSSEATLIVYLLGTLAGLSLGIVAMETTERGRPPKRGLLLWLVGGFLMSMVWTYMTARELVALLVSFGHIMGISPLVLGLTVLAWGNSVGDLTANVAMAVREGRDGVHIAISGCYAGPIFNTLVGLGVSLVMASGATHPSPLEIPQERSLFEAVVFLAVGLVWALVVLPSRGMRPDKVLGFGLLAIYVAFLGLRLSEFLDVIHF